MRTRVFRCIFSDRSEHASELLVVRTETWTDRRILLHVVTVQNRRRVEHVWSEPEQEATRVVDQYNGSAHALRTAIRFHDERAKAHFDALEAP